MMKKHNLMIEKLATKLVVFITILSLAVASPAQACTRFVYTSGSGNGAITARNMDWLSDPDANLWVFPRGMDRDGGAGPTALKWTSKYGSIITASYNISTVDGINEKGLVTNLLFLTETDYGCPKGNEPTLSLGAWGQYVLDNYATVDEAVKELKKLDKQGLHIVTATLNQIVEAGRMKLDKKTLEGPSPTDPSKTFGELKFALHMSISDPTGDSAIFEYIDGKLKIHHDRAYNVLTNDPTFDEQLSFVNYWEYIGAGSWGKPQDPTGGNQLLLPGTGDPSARFIRASYYLARMNALNEAFKQKLQALKAAQVEQKDALSEIRREELATAFAIIRNVAYPVGYTQWHAVASQNVDPKKRTYLFQYTRSPNVVWAKMGELNLEKGQPARKIDNKTITSLEIVGDVSCKFKKTKPFNWDLSFALPPKGCDLPLLTDK